MRKNLLKNGLLCAVLAISPIAALHADDKSTVSETTAKSLSAGKLLFIENKGQITDQHRHVRKDIDFRTTEGDMVMYVGNGQIHYQFQRTENLTRHNWQDALDHINNPEEIKVHTYRLDVVLEGANINAPIITEQPGSYEEHYYGAGQKCFTAGSYEKLTYKNIYPRIDWVLYADGERLKYDFVVHPGGNPADIKLRYEGATALKLRDGGMVAETPMGNIAELKPYSYDMETGAEIASSFVLDGNVLHFDVQAEGKTIVLDPVINWSTYYGNVINTVTAKATTDLAGNVYVGGYTTNTANVATFGSHQFTYGGNVDGFLVKMNKNGTRHWATYYGGDDRDMITAVTNDKFGNIFIAGYTSDTTKALGTTGAHQPVNGGNGKNGQTLVDGFVAKFNTNGVRQWGTYYGGYFNDYILAMTCDDSGNVFIGGYTESPDSISTPGSFQPVFGGTVPGSSTEGFFAKLTGAGKRRWGTYYKARIYALACDRSSNLYIGGMAGPFSSNVSTAGKHQLAFGGGPTDGFISKFGNNGGRIWGSFYGGSEEDEIIGLACDSLNNVYLAGVTRSLSGIVTPGTFQQTITPWQPGSWGTDGMLVKMDSNGKRQWGTYYGLMYADRITDLQVSTDGYPYFAGVISTGGLLDPPNAMLVKFDTAGNRLWYAYRGDTGTESNTCLAMAYGKLYMAGSTNSGVGIATPNGFQNTYFGTGGQMIAYITQFEADTNLFLNVNMRDTQQCIGEATHIDYHTTNKFGPNNVFTAQLSNASGSFATPLVLGTRTSDSSGHISYTIPTNIPSGTGYKIRVLSSSPADTTAAQNISISPYPRVGVIGTSPICEGDTLKLQDTATGAPVGITYQWSGPNMFSAITKSANRAGMRVIDTGYYVLAGNFMGCVDKDSVRIVVKPLPNKPSWVTNAPVCVGDTLRLNASSSTTGVTNYNLSFYAGTSGTPTWQKSNASGDTTIISAQTTDAGKYIAVATKDGCTSKPDTLTVAVLTAAAPTVQISATPGVNVGPWREITFTASGLSNEGSNPAYQWIKNGVSIPNATTATFKGMTGLDLQTGDTVCLRMTSSFSCANPSTVTDCVVIAIDLGVDDVANQEAISIYPNPTKGLLNVKAKIGGTLQITNLHGQDIGSYVVKAGTNKIELPQGLAAGVYVARLISEQGSSSAMRIVVEK